MIKTNSRTVDISIVLPFYNEEDNIDLMLDRVSDILEKISNRYEIIAVDDGSNDRTFERLCFKKGTMPNLRVIKFRRNFGQTQAMKAGIDHARGKTIVTMDGDLQNDPIDIPEFIKKINEGYDIVCGWRHKREDKLVSRKIPSKIANMIIGKVTGVPIRDNGCSLKAYRADVMKNVPLYSDMHRFIPAMASLAGAKITEIKVRHHARRFGVSKYGISRTYKVIVDLLTIKTIISFASQPLRLFSLGALISIFFGIAFFFFSFPGFISGQSRFSFMMASGSLLFIILALFLMLTGLLCELINKTGNTKNFAYVRMKVE